MRGDVQNMNIKAFIKRLSDLMIWKLEISDYAYSNRYKQL